MTWQSVGDNLKPDLPSEPEATPASGFLAGWLSPSALRPPPAHCPSFAVISPALQAAPRALKSQALLLPLSSAY